MVKAVNGQIAGLFLPPVSGIFTERELKLEVNTWNGGIFQTTQTLLPDSAKKNKNPCLDWFYRHSAGPQGLNPELRYGPENEGNTETEKPQGLTEKKTKRRRIKMKTTETTKTASETTFGIELEFTGITRKQAAEILHSYLHSDKRIACHIFSYIVTDQQAVEKKSGC